MIKGFSKPSSSKSSVQIVNTLVPYFLIITAMYFMISYGIPYIFTLLIAFIASLFLVRIFILFHDCTHNSFLSSRRAMSFWGHFFGILTFTSFYRWKKEHMTHHSTVGNIDKRGIGDVWTMTVNEYNDSSSFKKFGYRLYRNPFILFVIGPIYVFLINQRFPTKNNSKKEWVSLIITNLFIIAIILTVSFTIGFKYYLLIQLPIILFGSSMGVWLFYVQHQYEDVYWENTENWSIQEAALQGSSVYKLPRLLEWFTGYIGYHNIHHLNSKIPNYNLKKAFNSSKEFKKSRIITFFKSFKLSMLFLYDEKRKTLISYRSYKKLNLKQKQSY
jgi:omega-6 fatty acid desaturase (delta-12 desaturase)